LLGLFLDTEDGDDRFFRNFGWTSAVYIPQNIELFEAFVACWVPIVSLAIYITLKNGRSVITN
jgi:hypothetical protein